MNSKKFGKRLFVVGLLSIGAFGAFSASTQAIIRPPGRCICEAIIKPVLCPNGVIYQNDCLARCAGQTGCVPGGGI